MLDIGVAPSSPVLAHHETWRADSARLQLSQEGGTTNAYQYSGCFVVVPLYLVGWFPRHVSIKYKGRRLPQQAKSQTFPVMVQNCCRNAPPLNSQTSHKLINLCSFLSRKNSLSSYWMSSSRIGEFELPPCSRLIRRLAMIAAGKHPRAGMEDVGFNS
jgi:hypothetical protein